MFSNKENINILTRLLCSHGVSRVVVCPGSRNAPLVHNFSEAGMCCIAVTDERSAGFYAIGMALGADAPVAVCVTSGTALLNLAPAVAEAYYRHIRLIVVSADRPQAWIGQLDGQTLSQPGAFGCFVGKCVALPEPVNDEQWWHCERLVNEALLDCRHGRPVHINVPISEPLFEFTADRLPECRKISLLGTPLVPDAVARQIAGRLSCACRPMVVVGQMAPDEGAAKALRVISEHAVVLQEPLSPGSGAVLFDELLGFTGLKKEDYEPDFILYLGDTIVSKRLKKFLRGAKGAETWAVSRDGAVHDTFMNQTAVVEADPYGVVVAVAACLEDGEAHGPSETAGHSQSAAAGEFRERWRGSLASVASLSVAFEPRYSQMMAVKLFESMLDELDYDYHVHYANSSAVRLANIYAHHYIYVNRGVNGIEGSLSTAAGFSVTRDEMTFCVIGDLSFFYDSNALWNRHLKGNLRILLLNNCGGGIFHQLPGLEASPVRDSYVAAEHHASAHGLCDTHDIGYISARDAGELARRMPTFLYSGTHRPLVFEVFTDAGEDALALRAYHEYLSSRS